MKRFHFNTIIGLAIFVIVLVGFLPSVGCRKKPEAKESKGLTTRETESQWNAQLLEYAVKNLQRLDEFQGGEMRQQVIDRLNQWIRVQKVPDGWTADPMIKTLPSRLRDIPAVKNLDKLEFTRQDGFVLQEDVWLRDISNWARGERLEDMDRAGRLFDWTVRNIQIEPDDDGKFGFPRRPWEILLQGRGTASDRAWIFTILARQQGIDVMLLALPVESENKSDEQSDLKVWALGVLDQGKIYLFDPKLGLPIPAPDGVSFNDNRLDVQPATLTEVLRDGGLLKNLGSDADDPYPMKAEQLKDIVGLVVASPASLSARMSMFENKLSGDERVVLTDDPTAIAERFKSAGFALQIRLWQRPFETAKAWEKVSDAHQAEIDKRMAPFKIGGEHPLWRGRTLFFKGVFTGDDSATSYFQKARPSKRKMIGLRTFLLKEGHPTELVDSMMRAYARAKQDATYWLGVIAASDDDIRSTVDYLLNRTLKDSPGSPWKWGTEYNLARAYESAGEFKKAAKWLSSESKSPGRQGNRLRAKWLEAELAARQAEAQKQREAAEPKLPGLPQ